MTATRAAPTRAEAPIWHRLASTDPLDVVPRLLALLVIPTNGGLSTLAWTAAVTLVAATPALYRSARLWMLVGGGRLAVELVDWHGVDDHEVLISYGCMALGLALWCEHPRRVAARSLPLLVGLTMLFATGWKLGAGQFVDGDTLRYTLLTDPRFELASTWFGTMAEADIAVNASLMAELRDPAGPSAVTLVEPRPLHTFALGLSAGAILLEGALAVAFLTRRVGPAIRAGLLAVFCVSTYLIVPVSRFGIVLLACAYAGSAGRRDRRVLLITVAFCLVWPVIWVALGGTQ